MQLSASQQDTIYKFQNSLIIRSNLKSVSYHLNMVKRQCADKGGIHIVGDQSKVGDSYHVSSIWEFMQFGQSCLLT